MKSSHIITISFALAALCPAAHAQFNGGGFGGGTGAQQAAPPPAWAKFALNPKVRINLDFRNASIDAVLHVLSQASGVAIIKDPALTGGITLQSPKPQSLNDAFAILNAVLNLKNYEIASEGNFLLVRPRQSARSAGGFGAGSTGGFGGRSGRRAQTELQTYVLRYADATAMARVINDVFATTANATNAGAFAVTGGAAAGGNGGGRGGRRGGFGGGGSTAGTDSTTPPVKASADAYSNALIVNATAAQQEQIANILNEVDQPADNPQHAQVFKLAYALASDLQPVIQSILSGSSTLGRGATATGSQQNRGGGGGGGGFGGFFGRFGGGGGGNTNTSTANGTVTAEPRTNTLVVTATPANLQQVAQVIQTLDKPATYTSSTFVYVMKNARADVVANLLNQSFGNRTTNGPTGGSLTNPSFASSSLSSSGSASPTSLTSNTTQRNNTTNNATVTASTTNQQNQTPSTTGLDSDGRVINIRNLSGSVLLVPNIDTNSIIVVAPPEDRAIIESILQTMDEIPEQVMIETLIVETNLTKANQLGVEYNIPFLHGSTSQTFGLQPNTVQPQGLRYTLTAGQYSVFLHALQTDTQFDVLSTPRIFTTNNATAQINISQSLPYVTNSTFDTNGTQIFNYNFLDVGIVLTVTPRITSNGYVTMDVTQTANDFVGYTSFNAPIVNQREAQTTVSVKDGETVVLGGIINNSVNKTANKIPVLGDIPLLGSLFRSTTTTKDKTELLVFMTPHVVHTPEDAARLRAQTEVELGRTARGMLPTATPAPTPQPAAHVSVPAVPAATVPTRAVPASQIPPLAAPTVSVTVSPTTPATVPPSAVAVPPAVSPPPATSTAPVPAPP